MQRVWNRKRPIDTGNFHERLMETKFMKKFDIKKSNCPPPSMDTPRAFNPAAKERALARP